jgi:hypothetical protein
MAKYSKMPVKYLMDCPASPSPNKQQFDGQNATGLHAMAIMTKK